EMRKNFLSACNKSNHIKAIVLRSLCQWIRLKKPGSGLRIPKNHSPILLVSAILRVADLSFSAVLTGSTAIAD
ncbi:MAG: hypothetical protein AAGF58_05345, partial [Pseudomonadota bacterium]